ncbi:MAG: hypothetical protein A2010_02925 [Nitrospirae bacterium GWD2_57_9]|nr:MAG: hypothetical protein A2010_02925 [Nitrospirae bacterium GWD2_57_9]OGW45573.1 MAG: hypothetical protein A2078_07115 [Nitrospirae bacterium GWC2_57_9]
MPLKIKILPDTVINKIAAGEVVDRPSSVVKELVENSLDAGSTEIVVDVEQAGRRLIRIMDNGCGMSPEDARAAFGRHATSKITTDSDLEHVRTMGFRGEALSSIAAVSHVRMTSAERGGPGVLIEIEGGALKGVADAAAPSGTSIEISHLFYNVPARLKFLKSPATEFSHIVTALSRQAMANPSVRFRLSHNKKQVLDLPPSRSIKERVFQLYGSEIADNVLEFIGGRDTVGVQGLLGRPGYSRGDKTYQDFYVNRRAIRNASLSHALYAAYSDMLMRDRHPVAFLFIDMDPAQVDVNVHPAKAEVRFRSQSQVHDLVRDAIREGLRGSGQNPADGFVAARDGVKEAVSDYLQSAEFKKGYPDSPRNQTGAGIISHDYAQTNIADAVSHSAFRTPYSALLFPLAQVHDSFIVAQSADGMAFIDQHAAHERVLFEKLQDQHAAGTIAQQNLLIPVPVELGHAEIALLSEHLSELQPLGFSVEDFGAGTFMIKAVPAIMHGGDYKRLLLDILDEVKAHGASTRLEKLRDEILSVMACHPAIKVHRKLDSREMEQLLADLFQCRMPHTCPHGRPTMVKFSLEDLKKLFKRT